MIRILLFKRINNRIERIWKIVINFNLDDIQLNSERFNENICFIETSINNKINLSN